MIFGIVRYVSQEGNDRRGVYHSRSSSRQVPGYAVDDGRCGTTEITPKWRCEEKSDSLIWWFICFGYRKIAQIQALPHSPLLSQGGSKELIHRWGERLPSLGIVREQQLDKVRGNMKVGCL
jgi:hypothetical protein